MAGDKIEFKIKTINGLEVSSGDYIFGTNLTTPSVPGESVNMTSYSEEGWF